MNKHQLGENFTNHGCGKLRQCQFKTLSVTQRKFFLRAKRSENIFFYFFLSPFHSVTTILLCLHCCSIQTSLIFANKKAQTQTETAISESFFSPVRFTKLHLPSSPSIWIESVKEFFYVQWKVTENRFGFCQNHQRNKFRLIKSLARHTNTQFRSVLHYVHQPPPHNSPLPVSNAILGDIIDCSMNSKWSVQFGTRDVWHHAAPVWMHKVILLFLQCAFRSLRDKSQCTKKKKKRRRFSWTEKRDRMDERTNAKRP